jgi:hypothetical protein
MENWAGAKAVCSCEGGVEGAPTTAVAEMATEQPKGCSKPKDELAEEPTFAKVAGPLHSEHTSPGMACTPRESPAPL